MNTEILTPYAKEMAEYALNNPCLSPDLLVKGIESGKYAKDIKISDNRIITIQTLVMHGQTANDAPFWNCSISFHSASSGNIKQTGLWTFIDKIDAQRILKKLLEDYGEEKCQDFGENTWALMLFRQMTRKEIKRTGWMKEKAATIEV